MLKNVLNGVVVWLVSTILVEGIRLFWNQRDIHPEKWVADTIDLATTPESLMLASSIGLGSLAILEFVMAKRRKRSFGKPESNPKHKDNTPAIPPFIEMIGCTNCGVEGSTFETDGSVLHAKDSNNVVFKENTVTRKTKK